MAVSVLALGMAGTTLAQKKINQDEDIIIRKKSNEKMTIVVDGDKVTVNGKDIDTLSDPGVRVMRSADGLALIGPRIREKIRINGPKALLGNDFNDDFNFMYSSNNAVLGVMSENAEKGARITEVMKESAAAKAGLQKGDIITKVSDTKIENSEDLYNAIGKYKPEDKVAISYLRNGKENSASVILGKNKKAENKVFRFRNNDDHFNFPPPSMHEFNGMDFIQRPKLGMQVQDLDNTKGVKVLDVDEDTPAARAGLQKDDTITAIDGKEITSVEDIRSRLRDLKEGDSLKITYERNGKTQTTEARFPKKLKTADL
jgi:serine protease Do